jgi:hypothetical protein
MVKSLRQEDRVLNRNTGLSLCDEAWPLGIKEVDVERCDELDCHLETTWTDTTKINSMCQLLVMAAQHPFRP